MACPDRAELNAASRPSGDAAASRPCLLVNPRSFRSSWLGYAAQATKLARAAGLPVHEVVDPASLRAVLDQLRAQRQQQVWILSGDGTIHALAEYFAANADGWSPALLFLAGGRANIVPRECGGHPAMPALVRALAALREGRALAEGRIFTLQVSQAGRPARHGFLFAGAVIYQIVRRLAEHRARGKDWFHWSFFSEPWVLLRLALQVYVLRRPLPPEPRVVARLAGRGEVTAPMRVLLASTMELRAALYNPFAARGTGPVRLTAITQGAPRFWGRLPAMIRGRFDDNMDPAQGILSGRGERGELLGVTAYALDGELYDADPAVPLLLSAGVPLRVLLP
jgi:hypothetical protein